MSVVTPGRIVHYTLSDSDAKQISARRHAALVGSAFANYVEAGQVYPATIVRVWNEASTCVNLVVHLDGYDVFWATSRSEGEGPGCWTWPKREENTMTEQTNEQADDVEVLSEQPQEDDSTPQAGEEPGAEYDELPEDEPEA